MVVYEGRHFRATFKLESVHVMKKKFVLYWLVALNFDFQLGIYIENLANTLVSIRNRHPIIINLFMVIS